MQTTYLDIQNLSKSFGSRLLFSQINFSIAENQRVGLIAQNGIGKTTLLNIISGKESLDEGKIIFRNGIKVGYLEQNTHFNLNNTIIENCTKNLGLSNNIILEAKRILDIFEIKDIHASMNELSGGQIKRVALAKVLLEKPDLLILDEPTNHLDLKMVEWIENYLQKRTKALLMVTHDRYFLNRVCDTILELDNFTLYTYRGNYEQYLIQKEARENNANANESKMRNLYRKELDWINRMPKARGGKAKYRKDAFYELKEKILNTNSKKTLVINEHQTYIGNKIFEAQYVSKTFSHSEHSQTNKVILKDFYYNFSRYEKLGIIGENGTGKSTFVRLLLGLIKPDNGKIIVGETVKFGYFSQQGIEFNNQMKVIDAITQYAEYIEIGNGKKLAATQLLSHFLFPPSRQQDYIYKLSGGEKRRLYLCSVLMQNPNFLVLDEPTNDLDILTLQILEEYLQNFKGCLIIISHDRYFLDKVVDHLFVFKGNGIIEQFPGNYSQYQLYQENINKESLPQKNNKVSNQTLCSDRRHQRKLTFKEKQEYEKLEKEIEELENEKISIMNKMHNESLTYEELNNLSEQFSNNKLALEEKEMRWLELDEIAK